MSENLPKHSVSVTGVVVRDDGKILVIKRADDGRWVPPGGVLELDETPEEGVAREVLEETGVKVAPIRLVGVYKNMKIGVVSLSFLCEPIGGVLQTNKEATKVEWMDFKNVIEKSPEARAIRVADAFSENGPFVRSHDGTFLINKQQPMRE